MLHRDPLIVSSDNTLDEALEALTSQQVSWAPVVDSESAVSGQHVIGTLTAAIIFAAHALTGGGHGDLEATINNPERW